MSRTWMISGIVGMAVLLGAGAGTVLTWAMLSNGPGGGGEVKEVRWPANGRVAQFVFGEGDISAPMKRVPYQGMKIESQHIWADIEYVPGEVQMCAPEGCVEIRTSELPKALEMCREVSIGYRDVRYEQCDHPRYNKTRVREIPDPTPTLPGRPVAP